MKIFDLNHIEAVEGTEVLGGRGRRRGRRFDFSKKIDIDEDIKIDIDKDVDVDVDVDDNLADAEAVAQTSGKNGLSETLTFSYADRFGTEAASKSVSAYDS